LRYHQASDFRGFQGGEYMKANAARTLLLLCLLGSATLFWARAASAETIAASEAKNHIGEKATVCGKVVSAHYAARSRSQPTFLNLDKPYPQQIFTIVIRSALPGKSKSTGEFRKSSLPRPRRLGSRNRPERLLRGGGENQSADKPK
jgi:hypothetical protein